MNERAFASVVRGMPGFGLLRVERVELIRSG